LSFLLAPTPAIFIGRLFGKKVILNYHSGEAEDHLRCWPRTSVPIMKLADELIVPLSIPGWRVQEVWFASSRNLKRRRPGAIQVSRAQTVASDLFV
jgi:hypothetical protein